MHLDPRQGGAPAFAIGGLGGSGTRAAALIVRNCGCWIGDDLNNALDNLWYTLLFKRSSALTDTDFYFNNLFALFQARMSGVPTRPDAASALAELAGRDRMGHSAAWLRARLASFSLQPGSGQARSRWGWKEPNTHVLLERLFRATPRLKYVHAVRDPLYMAFSRNQNQLMNWGKLFLDRTPQLGPSDSLAFQSAVYRRLDGLAAAHPGRIAFFSFDAFLADPQAEASRLMAFLDLDPPQEPEQLFNGITLPRTRDFSADRLTAPSDRSNLAYCQRFAERWLRPVT